MQAIGYLQRYWKEEIYLYDLFNDLFYYVQYEQFKKQKKTLVQIQF